MTSEPTRTAHKPRVALMGEFSAGKSTLTNVLLGRPSIPVRVTATSLPPVWISYGADEAIVVDHDDVETSVSFEDLSTLTLEDAKLIRIMCEADILTVCDLIDMPGISDPNMPTEVWTSMIEEIDSVLWCTHANQAWRQSEAGVWERTIGATNGDNILLVSQIDKIASERDRERVLARVRKETEGVFKAVMPLSLTQAIKAGDDFEADPDSDLGQFLQTFIGLLLNPTASARGVAAMDMPSFEPSRAAGPQEHPQSSETAEASNPEAAPDQVGSVLPRRVAAPKKRTPRPTKSETPPLSL